MADASWVAGLEAAWPPMAGKWFFILNNEEGGF
jgi:hypothetical protein